MSSEPIDPRWAESLELSVQELLRRARPLPPRHELLIDEVGEDEGRAFLAAVEQ